MKAWAVALVGAVLFLYLISEKPVARARRRHHRHTSRDVDDLLKDLRG